MKNSLLKVMKTLSLHRQLNETSIVKYAHIHWQSTVNSLKVLKKKKIVNFFQQNDKKNNEKIWYLTSKNRAIVYGDNLLNYKENTAKWRSKKKQLDAQWKFFDRFDNKIWDNWIIFSQEIQKKWKLKEGFSMLRGLQTNIIIKILQYYRAGNYCEFCLENFGKKFEKIERKERVSVERPLLYLTNFIPVENGLLVCGTCGHEKEELNVNPKIKNARETTLGTIESNLNYNELMKTKKDQMEF